MPPTSENEHTINIRYALPDEAESIYALKFEAFGKTTLPYTIYRSARSINYLRKLITEASSQSGNYFVVAWKNDQLVGYYHAVQRRSEFFLNYVAVLSSMQRQGVGQSLLHHFEQTGSSLFCGRFSLDVLASTPKVYEWYRHNGYLIQSTGFHVSLDMSPFATGTSTVLLCNEAQIIEAQAEEQSQGFSKFECTFESKQVVVGLIDEHVCKLLSYDGVDVAKLIPAIAHRFYPERDLLVISSLPQIPLDWNVLNAEQILRLSKIL